MFGVTCLYQSVPQLVTEAFFLFLCGNFRIRLDVRVYSMRDVHSC